MTVESHSRTRRFQTTCRNCGEKIVMAYHDTYQKWSPLNFSGTNWHYCQKRQAKGTHWNSREMANAIALDRQSRHKI
jgi:hypothetical protein